MKTFKTIRIGFAAMMIVALAMMSSCSSKNDPINQIPENVDFAGVVNIHKVAAELGVEVTETDIKLPEEFEAFESSINDEVTDLIIACNNAIDLSNIVSFGYVKTEKYPDVYVIAKVNDEKALDAILVDELNCEDDDEDGFRVYTPGVRNAEVVILVKDGLAWIVATNESETAIKKVNKVIKRADEEKLIDNGGLKDVLTDDNVCNTVINTSKFIKLFDKFGRYYVDTEVAVALSSITSEIKDGWLTYTADMSKTGFELTAKFIDSDGDIITFPGLEKIDSDFLTFVPNYYQSAFAIGLDNDALKTTIDNIETLIEKNLRGSEKEICQTLLNYVRNIDGTISLNFGTEDLRKLLFEEDEKALCFVTTIEMKNDEAEKTVDEIYNLISAKDPNGEFAKKIGSGNLEFSIRNYGKIVVESIDNLIVISNSDIIKGNTNSDLKSAVSGNDAAICVVVPTFADLTDDACKFGAKAEITYKDGVCKATLDFTNLEDSMVSSMIELSMSFNQAYQTYRNNYWKSLYGY